MRKENRLKKKIKEKLDKVIKKRKSVIEERKYAENIDKRRRRKSVQEESGTEERK